MSYRRDALAPADRECTRVVRGEAAARVEQVLLIPLGDPVLNPPSLKSISRYTALIFGLFPIEYMILIGHRLGKFLLFLFSYSFFEMAQFIPYIRFYGIVYFIFSKVFFKML